MAHKIKTKAASMRYIRRMDNESHHGWFVSIKQQGTRIHKYFTDNVYGGKAKARRAAIEYRDELLKESRSADYKLWRCTLDRPNNTSGITGVARYTIQPSGGRKKRSCWQAFWHDADGKRRSSSFAIAKHGEKEAKRLACEARQAGLAELERMLSIREADPANRSRLEEVCALHDLVRQHNRIRPLNTSGIVGVGRYVKYGKQGNELPFWRAFWTDKEGQQRSRIFSIGRYGEEEAKRLACNARTNRERASKQR